MSSGRAVDFVEAGEAEFAVVVAGVYKECLVVVRGGGVWCVGGIVGGVEGVQDLRDERPPGGEGEGGWGEVVGEGDVVVAFARD